MAINYKSIAKKLKFEGRAFINGKYVNAIDGKKFETIELHALSKFLQALKKHKSLDQLLELKD